MSEALGADLAAALNESQAVDNDGRRGEARNVITVRKPRSGSD
jgi:hypothetical protein